MQVACRAQTLMLRDPLGQPQGSRRSAAGRARIEPPDLNTIQRKHWSTSRMPAYVSIL